MDFFAAMGMQVQCKFEPVRGLRPSKIDLVSSEDTNPEALEGWSTTVPERQTSGDKGTTYTEQSEVITHNPIMRQMTTSGVRKIGHGGDDIRRCDEPGRALEDFRPDEIDEEESGKTVTEEDDLRPDQREFVTRELALFTRGGASDYNTRR